MEHGAGVRLYRHTILRVQNMEVEGRHQRDERGGGGLMATHLQPIAAIHFVVGVVDHVGGEPKDLALKLAQHRQRRRALRNGPFHQRVPPGLVRTSTANPAALRHFTVSFKWSRSRVSITSSSSAALAGRSEKIR